MQKITKKSTHSLDVTGLSPEEIKEKISLDIATKFSSEVFHLVQDYTEGFRFTIEDGKGATIDKKLKDDTSSFLCGIGMVCSKLISDAILSNIDNKVIRNLVLGSIIKTIEASAEELIKENADIDKEVDKVSDRINLLMEKLGAKTSKEKDDLFKTKIKPIVLKNDNEFRDLLSGLIDSYPQILKDSKSKREVAKDVYVWSHEALLKDQNTIALIKKFVLAKFDEELNLFISKNNKSSVAN